MTGSKNAPQNRDECSLEMNHAGKWPRFQEIQNYLMAHGNPNWRALDDALIEFPKRCKELLLCNPNVGIDVSQANDLTHWLESCASHH